MCYFKKDEDPVDSYNKRDIFQAKKLSPIKIII